RGNNGRITFYNKFGCIDIQLSPSNLFVGDGAGIRSITSSRVTYLTKIAPKGSIGTFHILIEHRHNADREIASDPSANLEKTDTLFRVIGIPIGQEGHIFYSGLHGTDFQFPFKDIGGKNI